MRPARTATMLALALVGPAGCRAPSNPVPYARAYPLWDPDATAQRGETLDIQVFREAGTLEFTNTTARSFGPSTIWLNGWYSRPVESIGVGQTLRIPLHEFRDVHSEAFRGGGFFATEEPEDLVTVELETPGPEGGSVLYRLVVVSERGVFP